MFTIIDAFKRYKRESSCFRKAFPNATNRDVNNFIDIVRLGKEIEKYYAFEEIPSDSIRRKFSPVEERIFSIYEDRFSSGSPPSVKEYICELEFIYERNIL